MNFIEKLLGLLSSGFDFVGDMLYMIFDFLAKPLTYLYWFLDGIFYLFFTLFDVVVKIIKIFVALLQFFAALLVGFLRTLEGMLIVDFNQVSINYPSSSYQGVQAVLDVVDPVGVLDVVPLILIAVTYGYFVKKMIGLLGGEIKSNA